MSRPLYEPFARRHARFITVLRILAFAAFLGSLWLLVDLWRALAMPYWG